MSAPDHDSGQVPGLGFQGGEVPDASLVHPASIVYDQDVAWFGRPHCFQEDVHAAVVPHWEDPPRNAMARQDGADTRWSKTEGHSQPQAGIGNERG
jgi:hypothetical protein